MYSMQFSPFVKVITIFFTLVLCCFMIFGDRMFLYIEHQMTNLMKGDSQNLVGVIIDKDVIVPPDLIKYIEKDTPSSHLYVQFKDSYYYIKVSNKEIYEKYDIGNKVELFIFTNNKAVLAESFKYKSIGHLDVDRIWKPTENFMYEVDFEEYHFD